MSRHHRGLLGRMVAVECDNCHATVPYVAEEGWVPEGWARRPNPYYPIYILDLCPECRKIIPVWAYNGDGYA